MRKMNQIGAMALLPLGMAMAFDLTPDRGELGQGWKNTGSYLFRVFNIGKDNWGPINNCDLEWAKAQWRGYNGKRIGSTTTKTSSTQYDMTSITNGWFIPNPKEGNNGCAGSHITRGWQDTYGGVYPSSEPTSATVWPSYHVRVDPKNLFNPDENRTNNEIWMTMTWTGTRWTPLENMWITQTSKTLVPGDSVFLGVYSTTNTSGVIYMNGTSSAYKWTQTLADGNEKYGYQARAMKVTLSGGSKNTYVIKNGSKVTAEFLGQNLY
jgi:hypothetical protein